MLNTYCKTRRGGREASVDGSFPTAREGVLLSFFPERVAEVTQAESTRLLQESGAVRTTHSSCCFFSLLVGHISISLGVENRHVA